MKPLRTLWILALAAALGLTAGDAARAGGRELKLAHFMPPMHTLHQQVFEPLARDLAAETGGALAIRIYPAGALGKGAEQQYKRAVEGVADITFCIQSYTASLFPRSLLLTQPGVAASAEEGTRKLWEVYDAHLAVEYGEVKVLGLWVMSPTSLITRGRPVRHLADIQGMKIRIASPVESDLMRAWGAVPVGMPITESYNALSTGIVDAVLIQPSALYQPWNLAEPGEFVTHRLPSPNSIVLLAMNRGTWEGLPQEQQAALDRLTGRDFSLKASALWGGVDVSALEKAQGDPGIEVIGLTDPERAEFARAARPVIDQELERLEKEGIHAREIYRAIAE
jgi:TRAP-type C4-dicarboxylate transport system substrate-binding protein